MILHRFLFFILVKNGPSILHVNKYKWLNYLKKSGELLKKTKIINKYIINKNAKE